MSLVSNKLAFMCRFLIYMYIYGHSICITIGRTYFFSTIESSVLVLTLTVQCKDSICAWHWYRNFSQNFHIETNEFNRLSMNLFRLNDCIIHFKISFFSRSDMVEHEVLLFLLLMLVVHSILLFSFSLLKIMQVDGFFAAFVYVIRFLGPFEFFYSLVLW